MIEKHKSYLYAKKVVDGEVNSPKYVIKQARVFVDVAEGLSDKYIIDIEKVKLIDGLLHYMIMPSGLKAGQTIYEATVGYQWLFYTGVLCTVHKDNKNKRRYQTAILEICRKNFKTFTIAVIFLLLFFIEPPFSKFFSVAPDGALSREVQSAIKEIITCSPFLGGNIESGIKSKFKVLRDYIQCLPTHNRFTPLNYSNSRLDGRLPSVFLIDEAGALPNSYAIGAMRSGQLTILNKLGCIISTKYPSINNPFEDEVKYSKRVLDGLESNDTWFSLLYEPDNTEDWATDDTILEQANPVALEIPEIMEDLKAKRAFAIAVPSARENFLTKHCNIIYQGAGTESYIDIQYVQKCAYDNLDFRGRRAYVGVDLSMTTDNTAVSILVYDDDTGEVYCDCICFIPEGSIDEKTALERVNYREFIEAGKCIACGDKTIDYAIIEQFVFDIEKKYGCEIVGIGFDRYNALSSAQKWEKKYTTVEVKQHSSVLHPATKRLKEMIIDGKFKCLPNKLLEINFQNARCTYDTNMNQYVNKKKSNGKVDMVVSILNAMCLLEQGEMLDNESDWGVQY